MAESRYTTGGTVQHQEGGLYLVRPADQKLLELCRQSRFAYVLTPRQLGKSSLMYRTAAELLEKGFRAVMVDLTQIGTGSDAETWYGDLVEVVADQLELATKARVWWKQQGETGLTLRLTRFFEKVVLEEVAEPISIFVDEIDTTLSLDFTDDFFAAIHYLHGARARNQALCRLSFVLIGVASPADLIHDTKPSPFNLGERVNLLDFTHQEAAPLARGLPLPPSEAQMALDWILGWTGGHPYLSQRLCSVLSEDPPTEWTESAIDETVNRTFLGERSDQDNNLQFVRDMLTRRVPLYYGTELLRTYCNIWQGKIPVFDEEQSVVHAHLKLAGIVRRVGRTLVVRNRLYQSVFNNSWIEEQLQLGSKPDGKTFKAYSDQKPKKKDLHLRTVQIFLASSSELRIDRDAFELHLRRQNDRLRESGVYLVISRWETFLDAMSETRLQDEYNKAVRASNIFVSLFKTKTGVFTEEEFDVAHNHFKAFGKPLIFTYFMQANVPNHRRMRERLISLWNFQDRLDELGHYFSEYTSIEDLQLKFGNQLDQLISEDKL